MLIKTRNSETKISKKAKYIVNIVTSLYGKAYKYTIYELSIHQVSI